MVSRSPLAERLRAGTRDLHTATEALVGIPGAVRSRDDYRAVLLSSLDFYTAAREALRDRRWIDRWDDLGIDLGIHDRVPLLEQDLRALGNAGRPSAPPRLDIDTFAQALGLLYVVEGSSLGGQVIGRAIVKTIGAVPIGFYVGDGRQHPAPWRAVLAALARYERIDSNFDDVLLGATGAFTAFGANVSTRTQLVA
jgi:heme oxygenase